MVSGKHFVNDVPNIVQRSLCSAARCGPDLRVQLEKQILYRDLPQAHGKVILLSGGGSGHEPAHAGYVGEGMLDVAVAGNIFASPSASQILAGLRAVEAPRGVLMIVKNYTGDKLNFGLAAQKARLQGLDADIVLVGDDVSVTGNPAVGRRGLAGVVFVHKVAGALAATGADLKAVANVARKASSRMATAAASLDPCSVPKRGNFESLPLDELEIGMGIHNEPGVRRDKLQSLGATVTTILDMILAPGTNSWQPKAGGPVAAMINNLGGLSVLELSVVTDEVLRQLDARAIVVARSMSGTFVSSLDGRGFSVTLLGLDEELLPLLDAPTAAPAWPKEMSSRQTHIAASDEPARFGASNETVPLFPVPRVLKSSIIEIVNSIGKTTAEDEPRITEYDTLAGDGDCGQTLLNGMTGLVEMAKSLDGETVDLALVFRRAAAVAESTMGGTSGAIYAIYINAVASSLEGTGKKPAALPRESIPMLMGEALKDGLEELCKFTLARQGHRTLMDALIPFVNTFGKDQDFDQAFQAAQKGCERTRNMEAALGRASYVGKDRFVENGGIPDPGALGVVSILRGIKLAL